MGGESGKGQEGEHIWNPSTREAGTGKRGLIQGTRRTVHLGNALGSMFPRSSLRSLESLESVEENTFNDVGCQIVLGRCNSYFLLIPLESRVWSWALLLQRGRGLVLPLSAPCASAFYLTWHRQRCRI